FGRPDRRGPHLQPRAVGRRDRRPRQSEQAVIWRNEIAVALVRPSASSENGITLHQEGYMSMKSTWESFKVEGNELLDRVTKIIAEGNARSIVIKQDGRKVAEFPLTVGLVGAVFAPVLAAVGAL